MALTKKQKEELKYQIDLYGDKSRLKCNLEIVDLLKQLMFKYPKLRFWQLLSAVKNCRSDYNLFLEESFETKEDFKKLLEQ